MSEELFFIDIVFLKDCPQVYDFLLIPIALFLYFLIMPCFCANLFQEIRISLSRTKLINHLHSDYFVAGMFCTQNLPILCLCMTKFVPNTFESIFLIEGKRSLVPDGLHRPLQFSFEWVK